MGHPRIRHAAVLAGLLSALGASRAHAAPIVVSTDVAYRTVDGQTLRLDVCRPKLGGPSPAVLLIHGGGWQQGDKSGWANECQRLASAEGLVGVAVNYRLSPPGGAAHHPDARDDLAAAVAWLDANAATYRVAPGRTACLGDSAGGHLCLLLGNAGTIRASASWSGPSSLPDMSTAISPLDGRPVAEDYVGCALADCPAAWEAASPRPNVTAATSPTYLANSEAETNPLDQATGEADALRAAGVPSQLRVLTGSRHGKAYEADVWAETVAWLKAHI